MHWRLRKLAVKIKSFVYFYSAHTRGLIQDKSRSNQITFICGFHGDSGGPQAIANIANLLSEQYQVAFISKPVSSYNTRLVKKIQIRSKIDNNCPIYITDLSIDIKTMSQLKKRKKKIIITIHGFKNKSHQLSQDHIEEALKLADMVHFVSDIQQSSYKLPTDKYFIIPNTSNPILKTKLTNNIGSVGNLNDSDKGVEQTISIGLKSNAEKIHLWFKDRDPNMDSNRIICHDIERNKQKIYDSFDILVFMSKSETFGMVVIEAMSAGIPCVLSPLDVFKQFSNCPGIIILKDRNSNFAAKVINDLLLKKSDLREPMKKYFLENYAGDAILKMWENNIESIMNATLKSKKNTH